ncbi:hypothetical protein [Halalkalibacter lacteus]
MKNHHHYLTVSNYNKEFRTVQSFSKDLTISFYQHSQIIVLNELPIKKRS